MKRVGYASKNLGSKGVGSKRAYISGIKIFFLNEKVSCIFICWGSRVYREGDIKIPKKKEIPQKKKQKKHPQDIGGNIAKDIDLALALKEQEYLDHKDKIKEVKDKWKSRWNVNSGKRLI